MRKPLAVLAGLVLASALAACGDENSGGNGSQTAAAQFQKFASCLRKQGVDLPQAGRPPQGGQSPQDGQPPQSGQPGRRPQSAQFEAAMKACAKYRPKGGAGGPGGGPGGGPPGAVPQQGEN